MTPKLKVARLEYWDCGLGRGHRHKTKEIASKCKRRRNPVPESVSWMRKRDISIAILNGETYKVVGERYGVCGQRARGIFREVLRKSGRGNTVDCPLGDHRKNAITIIKRINDHDEWLDMWRLIRGRVDLSAIT